ncbi:MAG: hypothetical protein CMB76_02470 [Euryarchaeota archaeon]|nr:hypothetical protein [Euryarchaeota archaeon]|tara:strand:+ start:296 stop:1003 length:708 start_codon:yes stop_codon:yes gene_type:complete
MLDLGMAILTTGETLDEDGNPIPGTGFEYESDGYIAELLAQRVGPIISQPALGEFVIPLAYGRDNNGELERMLVIFSPKNKGPPEHVHPNYDELFEVISGDYVFSVNRKDQKAGPGDKLTVKKGVPHRWRNVGEDYGFTIAESRPAARMLEVLFSIFGMAHEGKLTKKGQPKLFHAIVIGREYSDDTVPTFPPPFITYFLSMLLMPFAKLLGYKSTEPRYLEDSFWEKRVNQPPK